MSKYNPALVSPNDRSLAQWRTLCAQVYKALREDDPDEATDILEEHGFGLRDAETLDYNP